MTRRGQNLRSRGWLQVAIQTPSDYGDFERDYISAHDELITNPSFDTDSDWTKGDGWSISETTQYESGYASCDGTQSAESSLSQAVSASQGTQYDIAYTIRSISSGTVTPKLGAVSGASTDQAGTHTLRLVADSDPTFYLVASADFVGTITLIRVRKTLKLFVDVNPLKGREIIGGMQVQDGETHKLEFRWSQYVKAETFLHLDSRFQPRRFRIHRTDDTEDRHEYIVAASEELEEV